MKSKAWPNNLGWSCFVLCLTLTISNLTGGFEAPRRRILSGWAPGDCLAAGRGQWKQAGPCLPCGVGIDLWACFLHPRLCEHPQHSLCCSDALLPWRPLTDFLGLRTEETVLGCWEDRVTSWSSPQASTTCQSSALHGTAGKWGLRWSCLAVGQGRLFRLLRRIGAVFCLFHAQWAWSHWWLS